MSTRKFSGSDSRDGKLRELEIRISKIEEMLGILDDNLKKQVAATSDQNKELAVQLGNKLDSSVKKIMSNVCEQIEDFYETKIKYGNESDIQDWQDTAAEEYIRNQGIGSTNRSLTRNGPSTPFSTRVKWY